MANGHNSIARDHLRSFVERIERLHAERRELQDDIKEVYEEAKGAGFDAKAMRALIRERAQDAERLAELQAIVETYKRALGMLADTPLGVAALESVGA